MQHKAVNLTLTWWKSSNSTEVLKSLKLYRVIRAKKQHITRLRKEADINGSMLIDTRWTAAFHSNHRLVFQIVWYHFRWVFLQTLAVATLLQPICLLECSHWFCSVRAVYAILIKLDGLSSHRGLYSNHLGTYHPVWICFWNSRVALWRHNSGGYGNSITVKFIYCILGWSIYFSKFSLFMLQLWIISWVWFCSK